MLSQSLSGLKVIDFTQIAAGPTCTMILADLGADVIKIESPSGELGRAFVPWIDGESVTFMSMNRNKRSIALDLKNTDHLKICWELLLEADVVVESFRPGVMQRLGLGHEKLQQHNQRLIYCSVSAYGQSGPWKDKPGVDGVIQAVAGLMSVTGSADAANFIPQADLLAKVPVDEFLEVVYIFLIDSLHVMVCKACGAG